MKLNVFQYLFLLYVEVVVVNCHSRKCEEIRKIIHKDFLELHNNYGEVLLEVKELRKDLHKISNTVQWQIPLDCSAALKQGRWSSITLIAPPNLTPREVRCDQVTEGGGWTVIVSRSADVYSGVSTEGPYFDGYLNDGPSPHPVRHNQVERVLWSTGASRQEEYRPADVSANLENRNLMENFNRSWQAYKEGFGSPQREFWIGNDVIHSLTKESPWEAMVIIEGWDGESAAARWDFFRVHGEEEKYSLEISGYQKAMSSLQDGLTYHNSRSFSTYDSDNDNNRVHCAEKYGGGWWFHQCHVSHLTGRHLQPGKGGEHAVHWLPWRNSKESLKSAKLMIRPKEK